MPKMQLGVRVQPCNCDLGHRHRDVPVAPKTNHTNAVVDLRLKLDTGLDDIDGGEGTVGDGTAKSTSEGEAVELSVKLFYEADKVFC